MEVHLTPEQEARLTELAARNSRSVDAIVREAILRYVEDEAHFVEAVRKGLASLDRGESISHEEVGKRIDRLFES
jgi:predicted transcriptional regulator